MVRLFNCFAMVYLLLGKRGAADTSIVIEH